MLVEPGMHNIRLIEYQMHIAKLDLSHGQRFLAIDYENFGFDMKKVDTIDKAKFELLFRQLAEISRRTGAIIITADADEIRRTGQHRVKIYQ